MNTIARASISIRVIPLKYGYKCPWTRLQSNKRFLSADENFAVLKEKVAKVSTLEITRG